MPEVFNLFARAEPAVQRALLAEPALADLVYHLPRCAGIDARDGEGLTVVRLPDPPEDERGVALPSPWTTAEVRAAGLAPAVGSFGWLPRVLPAPALVRRLRTLARETGAAIAWFYWFERGDFLHADAACVCTRAGAWLYARETHLLGTEGSACFDLDAAGPAEAWEGSPLHEAIAALGLAATTQYFIPEDDGRFDWERYRLRAPT